MLVSVSVFRKFRENQDMLGKLIEAGMNCARLNFSHGDHGAQGKVVARLRKVMQKSPPGGAHDPFGQGGGQGKKRSHISICDLFSLCQIWQNVFLLTFLD